MPDIDKDEFTEDLEALCKKHNIDEFLFGGRKGRMGVFRVNMEPEAAIRTIEGMVNLLEGVYEDS